jgi:integrase
LYAARGLVFTGYDPVTGRRAYKRANITGTDDVAWRKARHKRTELRAEVLKQRKAASSVKFDDCLDEWFRQADLEDSTRNSYGGYIERVIKPTLGASR